VRSEWNFGTDKTKLKVPGTDASGNVALQTSNLAIRGKDPK
jgi:hypothetical protein